MKTADEIISAFENGGTFKVREDFSTLVQTIHSLRQRLAEAEAKVKEVRNETFQFTMQCLGAGCSYEEISTALGDIPLPAPPEGDKER